MKATVTDTSGYFDHITGQVVTHQVQLESEAGVHNVSVNDAGDHIHDAYGWKPSTEAWRLIGEACEEATLSTLVLPDGTIHEGRLQLDDDGRPVVQEATCGACGFRWNDALITSVTPAPAGRCPNELAHEEPTSGDVDA